MKKKTLTEDFEDIRSMTNKIRSLNEAVNFDGDFEDDDFNEEPDYEEAVQEKPIEEPANGYNAVNKIREIALKGMVELCNTPEDPQYEVLKQIFNYCDKANKKKTETED